ncbi:solute carrier family 52, riboflavin transporter, member 3-A [Diachasma alloeum]|uniref:solute carrier family 52, riboflavin transporter, member 3-A n=1 Tax=Diachasma alloeum TaxID=454923 RepID=UPI0007383589|nr:solute carrier family 52, riboflavin transporter, member 3-A [Diachasma alloeum]
MSNILVQRLSNRKLLVDLLAVMFGIGAWIGVNGIYVQLPLLVNTAPEKWSLPAHMVMLVQFANLGPILYTLFIKYSSWTRDHYIIYGLLGTATLAIYLMSLTYKQTSIIFNSEHSTALLGLMFLTAVVGCTSSVLFMPYMRNYREIYLVSYLVGEGLSGFIPSTVALIQGVGGNPECRNTTKPDSPTHTFEPFYPEPRFSLEVFFVFVGTMLATSLISFIGLNKLPTARGELVKPPGSAETLPTDTNAPPSYKTTNGWAMPRRTYCYLLTIMGIICFLGHSTLPSIQSYSCLPYGNVAYHLTVTLASMATPLSMTIGFIQKDPLSLKTLTTLTGGILLLSAVVLYIAVQSPSPPLQGSWGGELLIILLWIFINGLIGFVKMAITTIFRPDPGRGLYYIGVATQVGSLTGAIITFGLVNFVGVFKSYSPCDALIKH